MRQTRTHSKHAGAVTAHRAGLLAMVVLLSPRAVGAPPQVDRFTLENGIRVVVLHVPESPHVSIFSYLPLGLTSDGPGQTQWSHLLEHLVLRSTVPAGARTKNAETLPDHMRLDSYGSTEDWREGLSAVISVKVRASE